jgi:hypothetical protein
MKKLGLTDENNYIDSFAEFIFQDGAHVPSEKLDQKDTWRKSDNQSDQQTINLNSGHHATNTTIPGEMTSDNKSAY